MVSSNFNSFAKIKSSVGIKYPTNRDHPLHTGHQWIEGKRSDDGAESLWRIHDNLYDFQDFIENHPGGDIWLRLTKGTDITEAFHAHHIKGINKTLLEKYFIKKADTPRNYHWTFHEDGFYNTLRRKIVKELPNLPKRPIIMSETITDLLLIAYISLFILAVSFRSFALGILAGVFLALTANAAHNFFHKRDNFRMYYFDFSMMQSREWRISHALSHHIYTNTVNDMEISSLEPFIQYLPHSKNLFFKYLSWFYSPIVYAFLFFGYHIKSIIQTLLIGEKFRFEIFLCYTVPILAFVITKESVLFCTIMFIWIILSGGVYFGFVGVTAAHHHPDIFHDGDAYRGKEDMDWGIFQLDAVMDRTNITGSHFLVLTNYGDHALHHLFPTLDHGLLDALYPILWETCKEFGVEHKISNSINLIKGQYQQLSRVQPNKIPPKPSKMPI